MYPKKDAGPIQEALAISMAKTVRVTDVARMSPCSSLTRPE